MKIERATSKNNVISGLYSVLRIFFSIKPFNRSIVLHIYFQIWGVFNHLSHHTVTSLLSDTGRSVDTLDSKE